MANGAGARDLIADRVYEELRNQIITLALPPGKALREGELTAALGIGRTPLRDAIKRLSLEGLVVVRPRQGTAVSEVATADIVHVNEVRLTLEPYAAVLAARRLDQEHARRCEELIELASDRNLSQAGLIDLDDRIHRFAWEASRNPYLVEILDRQFALSVRIWHVVLDRVPSLGGAVQDLAPMLEAILRRDSRSAGELMRDHVVEFQHEILLAFNRDRATDETRT